MKRFINLKGHDTGCNFAWWCTVRDHFEQFNSYQAWDDWEDFVIDFLATGINTREDLKRYTSLFPNEFIGDIENESTRKVE